MDQSHATMVLFLTTLFMMASSPAVVVASKLSCQPNLQIEFARSSILKCDISEGHGDVYWFRGTDTTVFPILWLENDEPGGKEYEKGEYSITSEGLLVIIDPQLHHEGEYTIRVYFPGQSPETATMMVDVFIMPEPPCPTISLCHSNCDDECQDITDTSGEISCAIYGAHPKTDIAWDVIDQSGVSSTISRPIYRHEEVTDTWNSSVSITYNTDVCGGFAVFQCTASSTVPLLSPFRNITVSTPVTCDMPTSTIIPESEHSVVFIIVPIGVVLILFLLIGCWCLLHYHRKGYRRNDVQYTDVPLEPSKVQTRRVKPLTEGEKKKLILDGLSESYKKFTYVKPLPWDELVLITSLYTPCECEIKSEKGVTKRATSEELFSGEFYFDNKRTLIVADLGYGKTTFTQHAVDRWISKKDDSILVYTHLKDVEKSTTLSDVVLRMLPDDTRITSDDIDHILEASKCHFLLDGLDEMSMSLGNHEEYQEQPIHGDSTAPDNETLESRSEDIEAGVTVQNPEQNKPEKVRLTIESLLNGQIPNSFKNLFVWVTTRDTDDSKNPFVPPFARVTLTGFNDNQVQEYIKRTCEYYIELRGADNRTEPVVVDEATKNTKLETDEAHTAKSTNDTKEKECSKSEQDRFETRVKSALDMNDIVKEFSGTPLLLVMVIHIIASKIAYPTGRMREVNINKLTTIVRMVISCLESRYFQKIGQESLKNTIDALELALGHVAFTQKMGVTRMKPERWDKLIGNEFCNIAVAIGLLRLSKNVGKGTALMTELAFSSYTGVEFYHQYFQEFLAAQYVPASKEEEELFKKYLKDCTDEKTLRFLQFMTGSNNDRTEKVLCTLTKEKKMWNNLIDCLFEDENNNRVKGIITQISDDAKKWGRNPIINVTNLKQNYHRAAFANFCILCREHNIKIHKITFREKCYIDFMSECRLPELKGLYFLELSIGEDELAKIIELTTGFQTQLEKLGFIKCQLPESVTGHPAERIKAAMANCKMEINRKKKEGHKTVYIQGFNPEKGTWGKRWFPKNE